MKRILNHIRGNLVGYVALFVALGGTSYAAVSLPAGSVGTPQLRNGSVTSAKLASHSVTPSKFDPRVLGGSIRYWAHIGQTGQVFGGSPGSHASVAGNQFTVTWGTEFSPRCAPLMSPAAPPGGGVLATSFGVFIGDLGPRRGKTAVIVWTYNGDTATPAAFSIAIVC